MIIYTIHFNISKNLEKREKKEESEETENREKT
jgi:hypothetical protein